MPKPLFDHINRFVTISPEDKAFIEECITVQDVHKKDHLLSAGEICPANYFIIKGLFRMYFVKETGIEHTIQFGLENWWITDFTSLENHKPSKLYIQAVEPSEVAVLTRANQERLFRQVPPIERYFRLIAQRAFAASLVRIQYLFELSVETRYEQFNRLYPEFVQRVPQYMLANFLGFTPEVLSKIRAKKGR
jgi:CRP-like cAMP-binding protein